VRTPHEKFTEVTVRVTVRGNERTSVPPPSASSPSDDNSDDSALQTPVDTHRPTTWTVRKRTSELRLLHDQLVSKLDAMQFPSFPEFGLSFRGEDSASVLEQKGGKVQSYLEALLHLPTMDVEPLLLRAFRFPSAAALAAVPSGEALSTGSDRLVMRGFGLPEGEQVQHRFTCALIRGIAISGRMFVSRNYICFLSNFFGIRTEETIPFADVVRIGAVGNVLSPRIVVVSRAAGGGKEPQKELEFGSFSFHSRDSVLRLLLQALKRHKAPTLSSEEFEIIDDAPVAADSAGDEKAEETNSFASASSPENSGSEDESGDDGDDAGDILDSWISDTVSESQLQSTNWRTLLKGTLPCTLVQGFSSLFHGTEFERAYHQRRGDSDIVVGDWQNTEFGRCREVTYTAPVSSPIGPSETRATEAHRIRETTRTRFVLEVVQVLMDVPMADSFRVEMVWTLEQDADGQMDVQVEVGVNFLKSTWFRGKIESGTYSESEKSLAMWLDEANKTLARRPATPPASPVSPKGLRRRSRGRRKAPRQDSSALSTADELKDQTPVPATKTQLRSPGLVVEANRPQKTGPDQVVRVMLAIVIALQLLILWNQART
jgi:VAD1 Analog of StAR-related lipid transfer domain/GRAM domain/PX domain